MEHAAAGGGLAPEGHAAAMEPFGKEVGLAAVALGDAGRRGQGVALFEEPRRDVRQRAALDLRHAIEEPLARLQRVAAAHEIDAPARSFVRAAGRSSRPWAAPIWAGVPETMRIVLPWQRQSRPWPAGSRATTRCPPTRWASCGSWPPRAFSGEVEHGGEHAAQVRLLDLDACSPSGGSKRASGATVSVCQPWKRIVPCTPATAKAAAAASGRRRRSPERISPGSCLASFGRDADRRDCRRRSIVVPTRRSTAAASPAPATAPDEARRHAAASSTAAVRRR